MMSTCSIVYSDEQLDCPLADCRLTYRLLDAYINLAFLDRAGVPHGPARPQFERGRKVLDAIVPAWREAGPLQRHKDPVEGGVALDTYCIVGLLHQDRAMAKVAAGHLDGDDWLPGNHYDDSESFRKLADETWCVRLLRFASRRDRRQVPRLAGSPWTGVGTAGAGTARGVPGQRRTAPGYLLNDLEDRSLSDDLDSSRSSCLPRRRTRVSKGPTEPGQHPGGPGRLAGRPRAGTAPSGGAVAPSPGRRRRLALQDRGDRQLFARLHDDAGGAGPDEVRTTHRMLQPARTEPRC